MTSSEDTKHVNRLIAEKSPYLVQHAYNPVDWFPWGDEAFEKARKEKKPLFLSIGYSTCHWCHVMAHESFEDAEVARLMNEVFVSVKVDREERPDIDALYMTICQMMTGSGGWPLTIIMTPEKKPFFAATYIPKETRFGRIGMIELIPRIAEVWKNQFDRVEHSADQITKALRQVSDISTDGALSRSILDTTYHLLAESFDDEHGGFGSSPKFPTPHNLLFLLRYWKRTGDSEALAMVEKTLTAMRSGGIYDQLGFGFHRYSTDQKWLVPHFEKMLYDQAMLAIAYTEAYQATGNHLYKHTAQEVLEYVMRDMTSPEGGFFSAEDADSEGIEGKFYVWTEEEIRAALSPAEAEIILHFYTIEREGNFSEEASGEKTGENILHITGSLDEAATAAGISPEAAKLHLQHARQKLFSIREKRIRPFRDDKILTDWNGLMIAACARAAQVFGEQKYAEAAKNAVHFILTSMKTTDGRLLHRYRDKQAAVQAYLNDYAFLIWGLIELYEATFEIPSLESALSFNEEMIAHFWDTQDGGLYFTPDDGENLLIRQKEISDGAVPSGNSIAMWNLLRLGRITGNPLLEQRAEKIGKLSSSQAMKAPLAFTQFMVAMDFQRGPSYEVVIVGSLEQKDTQKMIAALRNHYAPNKIVLHHNEDSQSPLLTIAPFIRDLSSINGATAYVCHNFHCNLPTTDITEMLELLAVKH